MPQRNYSLRSRVPLRRLNFQIPPVGSSLLSTGDSERMPRKKPTTPKKPISAKGGVQKTGGTKRAKGPRVEIDGNIDERVDFTESLMASGLRKYEIKQKLREKYNVEFRTAERYMARARERILAGLRETRDDYRADAIAFYRSVIANAEAPVKDKIRAQEGLSRLLGLNAPLKVAQTDSDGNDISPDEARARVSDLARRVLDRIGDGGAVSGDSGAGA